jgi:hypothetical protein
MFWAMISKKGGNTPWAMDLEINNSSASLYSAHGNSIVTPQNRQTDDKKSSTASWQWCFKGCISRCAVKSSGVWEATFCSHLDFPQELRSMASSTTLLARDITTQ